MENTDPLFITNYVKHAATATTVNASGGAVVELAQPAGISKAKFVRLQPKVDIRVTIGKSNSATPATGTAVSDPTAGDLFVAASSLEWLQLDQSGSSVKIIGDVGAGTCTPIWAN